MKNAVKAAIGGLVCLSTGAHALERVSAFHSDIRIAASGELAVTETIELQSGARDTQRGIVRELFDDYRDRAGNRAKVPLVVDRVTRNGRPEPYALERGAGVARIRTGEPGRALLRGKHVYQIAYRTARQVGFLDEHDELYWNVGRGLGASVERMSAEVSFERPVAASGMKLEAYTGPQGVRGQEYHAFVREGSAAFRATRLLGPRETMSIIVEFPKGVVERPSPLVRAAWYLAANRGIPVGAAVLVLMLAFLFACRRRFGGRPAPLPHAAPPEGVGPGGVRFIDQGSYDERCLGAAILGLQSRGYLRVHEHGERLKLERTGDDDLEWFPGERSLARRLLRDQPRAEIRRHGRTLEEAGKRLAPELREAFGRRRWASHGSFVLAAAAMGAVGVLAMLALETPAVPLVSLALAMAASVLLFAFRLMPICSPRGREHQEAIDALRQHLANAEPATEEEFARLLPYAVALELEKAWGRRFAEKLPANLVQLTPRVADKAPAPPRRPLRHSRSAAA